MAYQPHYGANWEWSDFNPLSEWEFDMNPYNWGRALTDEQRREQWDRAKGLTPGADTPDDTIQGRYRQLIDQQDGHHIRPAEAEVRESAPKNASPDEIARLTAVLEAARATPVHGGRMATNGHQRPDPNRYVDARPFASLPRQAGSFLWKQTLGNVGIANNKTAQDWDVQYAMRDPRQVTTYTGLNNYAKSWAVGMRPEMVPVECRITPHIDNQPYPHLKGICPTNAPQDVFVHQIMERNPQLAQKTITINGQKKTFLVNAMPLPDDQKTVIPLMEVFELVMGTGKEVAYPKTEFKEPNEGTGFHTMDAARFREANIRAIIAPPHAYVEASSHADFIVYHRVTATKDLVKQKVALQDVYRRKAMRDHQDHRLHYEDERGKLVRELERRPYRANQVNRSRRRTPAHRM